MTNLYYYRIYGLRVQSSEFLPYLAISIDAEYDLSINIIYQPVDKHPKIDPVVEPVYASDGLNADGIPYLTIWRQHFASLHIIAKYVIGTEIATFTCDRSGNNINVYLSEGVRFYDMIAYLYGPIFGCILRLRNSTCIHGGVININGNAVIITGHKEAGKSTLIASLAARGCPVLSDDIATLSFSNNDGHYSVLPGYPCLRLWEDIIVNVSNQKAEQFERVLSFTDKYYLPLTKDLNIHELKFQETELPLKAIYFLKPRNTDGLLTIRPVSEYEAVRSILQNAYAGYMLEGMSIASEFRLLSDLVKYVKVRALEHPNDISYLNDVCECLIDDNP
ncbi:MAG: hypothetical protein JST82_14255 [Bacteroidetes bacterium]|nr:hypothetical protein [Bacteroidota bacterium]